MRWVMVLAFIVPLAACIGGDGDADDVHVETGQSTTTTLDREALGLKTDTACFWETNFDLDEWSATASSSDLAEAEVLLDGLPLSDFFIQATKAETRQACDLFGGEIVLDP